MTDHAYLLHHYANRVDDQTLGEALERAANHIEAIERKLIAAELDRDRWMGRWRGAAHQILGMNRVKCKCSCGQVFDVPTTAAR